METTDVPKLKSEILTERITLALKPETKARLQKLKSDHRVDYPKWIRWLIDTHLTDLEKNAGNF